MRLSPSVCLFCMHQMSASTSVSEPRKMKSFRIEEILKHSDGNAASTSASPSSSDAPIITLLETGMTQNDSNSAAPIGKVSSVVILFAVLGVIRCY